MRTTSPALTRAKRHLLSIIPLLENQGKNQLPPIRAMAAEAGVSYVSMWKAVSVLRSEGMLSTNHRLGVRLAGTPIDYGDTVSFERAARKPRYRWQQLRTRLEQDILNGVYRPGSLLPSSKELTRRHGICHETLQKALRALVDRGWLQPCRRRYRVPSLGPSRRHGAVALIVSGDSRGRPSLATNRSQDNFRYLESECGRSGVALHIITVDAFGKVVHVPSAIRGVFSGGAEGEPQVLGFIVWTIGMGIAGAANSVLEQCGATGRPVALLDESASLALPARLPRGTQCFSAACSVGPGRAVGRYLLQLGHRRIAYISPVHGLEWSQNRLAGLCEVFAEAGYHDGVLPLTAAGGYYPRQDGVEQMVEQLLAPLSGSCREQDQRLARAIRSSLSSIAMATRTDILHDRLVPLLDRALADASVTAWVAASDGFALDGCAYLLQRGVSVPQQVSVVGFDDTVVALQHGLTSYNFNCSPLMHAMLSHVLARRITPNQRGSSPVEIDGFVSVRRTTAGPPGPR